MSKQDSSNFLKMFPYFLSFFFLLQGLFFIINAFREDGGERNTDAREKHQLVASICAWTGNGTCLDPTEPSTQVCALTGNQTCNLPITG